MCGRFTELTNPNQLGFPFGNWTPRYNIAPTMPVQALRWQLKASGPSREICELRWGLIPSWASDHKIGYRTINARSETIGEKPSFRSAFKTRRCLILVDGYYEWKKAGKEKSTWYFRRTDQRPFVFLGLWEKWNGPKESPLDVPIESCTIITKEANALASSIHHRMPCIGDLDDGGLDAWLDPDFEEMAHLKAILGACSSDGMEVVRVGSYVNKVGNEGATCISELTS